MRTLFPIFAVALVLVVSAVAILQSAKSDEERAQAMWAEAEFMAFRAVEDESCLARAGALFTRAIHLARHKAPIYVSFGQSNSSSHWELLHMLNSAMVAGLIEESPPPQPTPRWLVWLDLEIQQSLQRGTSRVVTGDTLEGHLEKLSRRMLHGSSLSLRCYQAAVAEDPNYMPAWSALSMAADGELRDWALQEWANRDPENALPLYLRAWDIWETSKDTAAVLQLVAAGNQRAGMERYEREWTAVNPRGTWPREFAEAAGLESTTPVTTQGLKNFAWQQARMWDWADRSWEPMKRFPYELLGEEKDSIPIEFPPGYSRLDVAELMEGMGCTSIHSSPPNSLDVIFGRMARLRARGADEFELEMRKTFTDWILRENEERKRTLPAQLRGEFDYSAWVSDSLLQETLQPAFELFPDACSTQELSP